MTVKKSAKQIKKQIAHIIADYQREPSDRTLGYLQQLLNYYGLYQKPIDFMDKPLNELPITTMGQGRTDALEWLHGKN
jgi:hypothetical protein